MKRTISTITLGMLIGAMPVHAGIKTSMYNSGNACLQAAKNAAVNAGTTCKHYLKSHPYLIGGTIATLASLYSFTCNAEAKKLDKQLVLLESIRSSIACNNKVEFADSKTNLSASDIPCGQELHTAIVAYNANPTKLKSRVKASSLLNAVIATLETRKKHATRYGFMGRAYDSITSKISSLFKKSAKTA